MSSFNGTDSFTYNVTNGTQVSNTATITVYVGNWDDMDTGYPDFTTNENISISGSLTLGTQIYSLTNDTPDTAHGAFAVNDAGDFTYTPDAGYVGGDSFSVTNTYTDPDTGGEQTPYDYTFYVNVEPLDFEAGWPGLSQAASAAPYVAVIPQLSPSLDWSTLIGSVQGMLPLNLGVSNLGFNNVVTMSISGGNAHIEVYDDGSDGFDAAEVAGYGTDSMTFGTNAEVSCSPKMSPFGRLEFRARKA